VLSAGALIGAREIDRGGAPKIEHPLGCFNAAAVLLIVVALIYYACWLVLVFGVVMAVGRCTASARRRRCRRRTSESGIAHSARSAWAR
jgi:Flp pilus assembly protein TadB